MVMDMLMDWLVCFTDGRVVMDGLMDGLVCHTDSRAVTDGWMNWYRWRMSSQMMMDSLSDIDGWSDGLIAGLTGEVTDGHVNDELMGCQTDWSYDRQMGMTDGLAVSQTDSATDRRVDLQTDGIMDRLVVQQMDMSV